MLALRRAVLLIFAVAIAAMLLWSLVPAPQSLQSDVLYSPLGAPLTLFDTVIALGGTVLFFLALRSFKPQLKSAYRLIAFAQLSVGLCAMLYPYIEYYNLWENSFFNLSSYVGYFAGAILMFLGARRFYKTLRLKSRAASIWVVFGLIVVGWIIHAFLPHDPSLTADQGATESAYDTFEVFTVLPLVAYGAALYLIFRIRQKVGKAYQKAFTWLAIGIGLQWLSALNIAVLDVIGYHNWYFATRVYFIPAIFGDIGLLAAAFQFNAVGLPYQKGWLRGSSVKRQDVSSVDIIVYLAGKVADPSQIDQALDPLRSITSRTQPGSPLTLDDTDQQVLLKVYLDVEGYLVTKDTLRSFSKKQVRQDILQRFAPDTAGAATFWPLLGR